MLESAQGQACSAALAAFSRQKAGSAEDRYNLVVTVNDAEAYRAQVIGSPEAKAVLVPHKVIEPRRRQPRPVPHRRSRDLWLCL